MIDTNTTRKLVQLEDELRAQKVATSLNFGALARPEDSDIIRVSGFVSNRYNPAIDANAMWLVKFQRSDGVELPPLAQMGYEYKLEIPTYMERVRSGQAISITGRDPAWDDYYVFFSEVYEVGVDYISWVIIVGGGSGGFYYETAPGTNVELAIQVNSPVHGNTTVERVG